MMVTVEQKTRVPDAADNQVRDLIGVGTKKI
jgi:hypothetical protein